MIEAEQLREAAELIACLGRLRHAPEPRERARAQAWIDRWQMQLLEPPQRIVFDPYYAAGFIWVGCPARPVPHPGLAGIADAHSIFVACEPIPDLAPNALRNRLGRAAEWADSVCQPLARCVRRISVGSAGAIRYSPCAGVELVLAMPRE